MFGRNARRACACLCWSALGVQAAVAQNDAALPQGPSLALPEALARTLERNPDLVAVGFEMEAAEGRLRQAGLRPNPELGVTVQDVLGTDRYHAVESAETTVTLGWVFERGMRQRLVDAARADSALKGADADIVRLDAAAETARRFLACLAFQGRLRHAERGVALARDTVDLIAERVRAGGALDAELARAQAELARAELREEGDEHELLSAYHRLSAQWGETEPDFGSVEGDVSMLPVLEPFETLRARVEANPDVRRFMSRQRVDEAQVRLAQARSRPSWILHGGFRRYEVTDDWGLVGGVTAPLPVLDRNQGQIAAARADAARTRAQLAAANVRIETALFVLYQELKHDLQLAARLKADVIPRLEHATEDTRRAYELGRSGFTDWQIVQAELLDATSELLEAGVDAHRIVIEIERLTGVRAATPGSAP